jgi:hypothetical protein
MANCTQSDCKSFSPYEPKMWHQGIFGAPVWWLLQQGGWPCKEVRVCRQSMTGDKLWLRQHHGGAYSSCNKLVEAKCRVAIASSAIAHYSMQNSTTPVVTAQTWRTFERESLQVCNENISFSSSHDPAFSSRTRSQTCSTQLNLPLPDGALTTQTRQQAPSSVSPTTYSSCDWYRSGTGGSATRENSIDTVLSESSTLPFRYFQYMHPAACIDGQGEWPRRPPSSECLLAPPDGRATHRCRSCKGACAPGTDAAQAIPGRRTAATGRHHHRWPGECSREG